LRVQKPIEQTIPFSLLTEITWLISTTGFSSTGNALHHGHKIHNTNFTIAEY